MRRNSYRPLLDQLVDFVRAGDIEKFYDAIFKYLAEQHEMVANPYMMQFLQGTVGIVTP